MKKYKILFILCLLPLFAQATPVLVDGIYYNLKGTEAEVTNKEGGVGYEDFMYDNYQGEVNIPENVEYGGTTYRVTSIGEYAFAEDHSNLQWGLRSVTIPNSVTSIGKSAFSGCIDLLTITIPKNVTSIGNYAFYGCSNLTSVAALMPTPVEISSNTFTNRTTATLYVPKDSKSLYENADYWRDFKKIIEAVIFADENVKRLCVENWDTNEDGELSYEEAEAVTDLGQVFKGHNDITLFDELQYFTGLTSIGTEAFFECYNLTSITIPNSVTSIGISAFSNCFILASLTIPNGVTSIGDGAFFGCSGLNSISVASGNTVYDSRDNCNAIIETSSNTLITGCKNTVIPGSVTSIGKYAFVGCDGLTSLSIPNSVTSIGEGAFMLCGLTSITIPNSVTSIGDHVFASCSNLTSITIPNSVTSIGYAAFRGCI